MVEHQHWYGRDGRIFHMKYLNLILLAFVIGCQPQTPVTPPLAVVSQPPSAIHGKKIKETYTAKCVGVVDGDTIDVLTAENEQIRIRLDFIDTPEKNQPFGNAAKEHLSGLVFGKAVTVHKTGMRFKRQPSWEFRKKE